MHKEPKQKEGIARLMELAYAKKAGLTGTCTLSVLSSVLKIIPFFRRYIVLDNGTIIEQGTHSHLLQKNGKYASLWNDQQTAGSWKLA